MFVVPLIPKGTPAVMITKSPSLALWFSRTACIQISNISSVDFARSTISGLTPQINANARC